MKIELHCPKSVPKTQFNPKFLQGMVNRMGVGFYRYGNYSSKRPEKPYITRMKDAIKHYNKTGNLEFLIDVANYAMMEFTCPSDAKAFFKPSDSGKVHSVTQYFRSLNEE